MSTIWSALLVNSVIIGKNNIIYNSILGFELEIYESVEGVFF